MKLDFYFIAGFITQYDLVDVHFKEPEFSLTIALIPASLIVMLAGVYFVRKEYRALTVFITVSNSVLFFIHYVSLPSRSIIKSTNDAYPE